MLELVLLIGLPGAGKSTFFQARFAGTHLHLSKDLWPNVRRREERLRRVLREALSENRSVVVDNTNVHRGAREPILQIGRELGARNVGYVFEPDISACSRRNALRVNRARVPDIAMQVMIANWQAPQIEEGFDALHNVRLGESGFVLSPWPPDETLQRPFRAS